jgi:hypothetical protein
MRDEIITGTIAEDCFIGVPATFAGMQYELKIKYPVKDINIDEVEWLQKYIMIIPDVIKEIKVNPAISTRALAAKFNLNYKTVDNAREFIREVSAGKEFNALDNVPEYIKLAPLVKKDIETNPKTTVYPIVVKYRVEKDTARRALAYVLRGN